MLKSASAVTFHCSVFTLSIWDPWDSAS